MNIKKLPPLFLFLLLLYLFLTHSTASLRAAAYGLQLWYETMIPVLLPFMILSGTLIRMQLAEPLTRPFVPFLGQLFGISGKGIYCILMGFLCGFPMGARTIADFRERGELSYAESTWLLAFCNNLGPVYCTSFVLPLLGRSYRLPYLFGMYGLPLLYGLFLRYTRYRSLPPQASSDRVRPASSHLLEALDDAIFAAVENMLKLGGYMIFFNVLSLLPGLFFRDCRFLLPLFEISSGLRSLQDSAPLYTLLLLPFGGLCCLAQTGSCIRRTDLSLGRYLLHKVILTVLTAIYYLGWFLLFPESFLA